MLLLADGDRSKKSSRGELSAYLPARSAIVRAVVHVTRVITRVEVLPCGALYALFLSCGVSILATGASSASRRVDAVRVAAERTGIAP